MALLGVPPAANHITHTSALLYRTADLDAWNRTEKRLGLPDAPVWLTATLYTARFSAKELSDLVYERFNIVPEGYEHKQQCVYWLMEADKVDGKRWTGPFRFLDLAAEMRNWIYTLLLSMPKATNAVDWFTTRRCYPSILGVSKQLQREGTGILYKGNTREIAIACGSERLLRDTTAHCNINRVGESLVTIGSAVNGLIDRWCKIDPHIHKFQKLSISLELNAGVSRSTRRRAIWRATRRGHAVESCIAASRVLARIASQLVSSKALSSIELHLTVTHSKTSYAFNMTMHDAMLQKALWPLNVLGRGRTVKVTGVSAPIQKYIQEHAARDIEATLLPTVRLCETAVQLRADLYRLSRGMHLDEHPRHRECLQLTRLLSLLFNETRYVDAKLVHRLAHATRESQAFLGSADVTQLKERCKDQRRVWYSI